MFFVFVQDLKHSRHAIRNLFISFLLVLVTLNPAMLYADDYVHMIQYELLFGNKQPVSNLYMSMQSRGMKQSLNDTNNKTVFRTPVISTDPRRLTLMKPFSILYAADDTETDTTTPKETVGSVVKGLLGMVLVLGPLVYAASNAVSDINDICDDGCGIEVDIPELEIPELPEETGS